MWFVFVHSNLAQITGRPQKSLITHLDSDCTCKNKNICPKTTLSLSLLCLKHRSCCCCCLRFLLTLHAHGGQLGVCPSPASLGDTQHWWKLPQKEGEGESTRCPLKLPHGRDTWDSLSHFTSKSKSRGSAWRQADGYWRLAAQSTTWSFRNRSGHLLCKNIFFQTMSYKTWKAQLFPSSLRWHINKHTWTNVKVNQSVIK